MLTRRSLIVVSAICVSPTLPRLAVAAPRAGGGNDPYRYFSFLLEVGGVVRAGFRECSGLDAGSEPIESHPQSGSAVRRTPGLAKSSTIALKRGTTDDAELRQWVKDTGGGKVVRKNGSIILRDADGAGGIRWNFRQGWPTKWIGPSLDATGNEMVVETLEIAHEGLERV